MADPAPRYPSYDPDIERYEEKPAGNPVAHYQVGQSARANYQQRSVPLFLSDRDGVPDPNEYMPLSMKGQGSYYASRILGGAACGVAIALVAALLSSDWARDFMANAKASGVAAFSVASVAMQPSAPPSKVAAAQPKEILQAMAADTQPQSPPPASIAAEDAASAPVAVAAVVPTRDDVRTAYQTAVQGSTPQAAVAAPESAPVTPLPVPADIIHHLDPSEIAALLKRADTLIANGDLAAARLVLRRAAEAGDARAAMMLGGTYDPAVLGKLDVRGVVPDFAMARSWYEKAKRLGASEAAPQLDLLAKKQN